MLKDFCVQVGYLHLSDPARLQEVMNMLGVGTPDAASILTNGVDGSDTDDVADAWQDESQSASEPGPESTDSEVAARV